MRANPPHLGTPGGVETWGNELFHNKRHRSTAGFVPRSDGAIVCCSGRKRFIQLEVTTAHVSFDFAKGTELVVATIVVPRFSPPPRATGLH